jgi:hypothetical protein
LSAFGYALLRGGLALTQGRRLRRLLAATEIAVQPEAALRVAWCSRHSAPFP